MEISNAPGTLDSPYVWATPDDNVTGQLIFNHSAGDYEFAPAILQNVAVVHAGVGATTLVGGNTYTGGTTLDAGVLGISANANLGNPNGALVFNGGTLRTTGFITMNRATALGAGNGAFDVASGASLTQQGIVSGSGALTKTGPGSLTLSGVNTYAGGTVIEAGTLRIAQSGNLGTGPLTLNGGTLEATAPLTLYADTWIDGSGTISTTSSLTLEGSINGRAGVKISSGPTGTVILNGAHNALPTAFVTGQSTLQVNGTLEAIIDIGGASRLSGSGTVGNTSIQHGSTLSRANLPSAR